MIAGVETAKPPPPPPVDPGFVRPKKTTRGRAIQRQVQEEKQRSRFAGLCKDTGSEAERNIEEYIGGMAKSNWTTTHFAKPASKAKAARKNEKVKFGGKVCRCGHAGCHDDDASWWVRPEELSDADSRATENYNPRGDLLESGDEGYEET